MTFIGWLGFQSSALANLGVSAVIASRDRRLRFMRTADLQVRS
jgi:hypothetical protein